jgi:5'-nucleotidase
MNILLTNDDGVHAPGLAALHRVLGRRHRVFVVASELEQSAVGHAITLADPIKVKKIKKNGDMYGYGISGTPADCVRIGVAELIGEPVDLVVSGINLGANVGINILYSGTVSAATEAAILGLPAFSISLDTFTEPDFEYAAEVAGKLAEMILKTDIGPNTALNVNVPALPASEIKCLTWARQCLCPAGETFARRTDPRGHTYYWRGTEKPPADAPPDSDYALLRQGFVTVTPIHFDLTRHEVVDRLLNNPFVLD